MKTLLISFGLLLTAISTYAQHTIDGVWNTGVDNTAIEIKNQMGKIYSSDNQKATVGKIMIKEINKSNNVYEGKLYLAKRDKWIDATFVPNGNSLNVTISAGLLNKSIVWKLIK